MFPLSPTVWAAVGGFLLVVVLGLGVKVQSDRLATSKAETITVQAKLDLFKEEVRQLGEEAEKKAKTQEAQYMQLKGSTDEKYKKASTDLAALYARYNRLRNTPAAGAGGDSLPPAPTVTSSAARTCFDSAGLALAMGVLEAGVPVITEQGDAARLKLATAVEWAASLERVK